MHSQNRSFLPSKKQPSFNGSLPHNIELLRNFSSKSFSKFDSSTHPSVHITSTYENLNPKQQSRTGSIMDIVYRFSESSRIKLSQTTSNRDIPTEKSRASCKQLISNYNTVPQMPLLSSNLVGGFVGSKSQLGRRPTHGFGISMWDIIRELVDVVGISSANAVEKGNIRKNPFNNKKCPSIVKGNSQENYIKINKNSSLNNRPAKLKDTNNCQKQSYADVTKIKLDLPLRAEMTSIEISGSIDDQENCSMVCNPKPVLEHFSLCSENDNRSRITSECSIDSEDSFIVFEYCEGDDISVDDDCSSSDDEGVVDSQLKKEGSSTNEECSTPPASHDSATNKSSSGKKGSSTNEECSTPSTSHDSAKNKNSSGKKVQFAEGKNLVKVHHMVAWDYAYRSARIGPWEMLARDSERFRYRVFHAGTVLSHVLDPAHREAVFRERFAHSDSTVSEGPQ